MYYSSAFYLSICVEMYLIATLIRRLELKLICLHWFLCIPFSFLRLWYWIRHRLFLFLDSENRRLPNVDIILDKYFKYNIHLLFLNYFFVLIPYILCDFYNRSWDLTGGLPVFLSCLLLPSFLLIYFDKSFFFSFVFNFYKLGVSLSFYCCFYHVFLPRYPDNGHHLFPYTVVWNSAAKPILLGGHWKANSVSWNEAEGDIYVCIVYPETPWTITLLASFQNHGRSSCRLPFGIGAQRV